MANPPDSRINIYIVRYQDNYEELSTLGDDLRGLGNVVVTKANYNMMDQLIKAIPKKDNNLMVLLTRDKELDGNLQKDLSKIQKKNIRIILYPRGLDESNNFLIAKSKDQIIKATRMLQEAVTKNYQGTNNDQSGYISPQLPAKAQSVQHAPMQDQRPSHITKKGLDILIPQTIRPIDSQRQSEHLSEYRQLSSLSKHDDRLIGLYTLPSKNMEYNSLVNLLRIKYKNNYQISFKQIQSLAELKHSRNPQKVLLVGEQQAAQVANQLSHSRQINHDVFTVKLLNHQTDKSPNSQFMLQTHRIEDIEYLLDSSLDKNLQKHTPIAIPVPPKVAEPRQNGLMSVSQSPGRISMKSARKVYRNTLVSEVPRVLVYDNNQYPDFTGFYSGIPVSYEVTNTLASISRGANQIIIAPHQQYQQVLGSLSTNSKLVLYAKTVTPGIQVNHPLVSMVTSNTDQLTKHLNAQDIPLNSQLSSLRPSNMNVNANQLNDQYGCAGSVGEKQGVMLNRQVLTNNSKVFRSELSQTITPGVSKFSNQSKQGMRKADTLVQRSHPNVANLQLPYYSCNTPQVLINSVAYQPQHHHPAEDLPVAGGQSQLEEIAIGLKRSALGKMMDPSQGSAGNQFNRPNPNNLEWYVYRLNGNDQFQLSSHPPLKYQMPASQTAFSQAMQPSTIKQSMRMIDSEQSYGQDNAQYCPPEIIISPPPQSAVEIVTRPKQLNSVNIVTPIRFVEHERPSIHVTHQHIVSHNQPMQVVPILESGSNRNIGETVNNTITFSEQLHIPINTGSSYRISQFNPDDSIIPTSLQFGGDISYSLDQSIPQRIYEQKATSCRIIQPQVEDKPASQLVSSVISQLIRPTARIPTYESLQPIGKNSLGVVLLQSLRIDNLPQKENYSITVTEPIVSAQYSDSKSMGPQVPILQSRVSKNDRTNNLVQIQALKELDLGSRQSVQLVGSPIPNHTYRYRMPNTGQLSGHMYSRQSHSAEVMKNNTPKFQDPVALRNNSQYVPVNQSSANRSTDDTTPFSSLNYDVRTQNGVKIYKRKTQTLSANSRPLISEVTKPAKQLRPSLVSIHNQQNNNYNYNYNYNHPVTQTQPTSTEDRRSTYYNNSKSYTTKNTRLYPQTSIISTHSAYNVSPNLQKLKCQPRQSGLTHTEQYLHSNSFPDSSQRTSRINGININNMAKIPQSRPSKNALVVNVLVFYAQSNLQQALENRLKGKVTLFKYHDSTSLLQKVSEHRAQNLVVVLNQQLKEMDLDLEQLHPNVSIITFSRNGVIGTHPASTVVEVLSKIEKWYFNY